MVSLLHGRATSWSRPCSTLASEWHLAPAQTHQRSGSRASLGMRAGGRWSSLATSTAVTGCSSSLRSQQRTEDGREAVTLFALALVLVSALLHASWNLLAKRVGSGGGPLLSHYRGCAPLLFQIGREHR